MLRVFRGAVHGLKRQILEAPSLKTNLIPRRFLSVAWVAMTPMIGDEKTHEMKPDA